MRGKPVVLRERARRDIDEASGHYLVVANMSESLEGIVTISLLTRLSPAPA